MDKISADSGVSAVVMNYYSRLDHSRITFDFMLNEEPALDIRAYIESRGSKIFVMPALKAANTFRYIRALKEFYKTNDYKIIHGHVANSAVFYLGLAKNAPHRLIHSHSTRSSDVFLKRVRNRFLIMFIKSVATGYLACSKEAAGFLFGKAENVTIISNAIYAGKYTFSSEKREEIRSSLGLKDEFVIGHVGRFSAGKNHSFLIDVFQEIYKLNEDVRLILTGVGELYEEIAQKVKKLGLSDAIIFVGISDSIPAFMSAMDIFVLPSLFEGFGLVCVEAQASGLSVLASDNVPRVIDISGKVEFLSLDRSLWAKKLMSLSANRDAGEKRENKVAGGMFDIETQAPRLCEYYENLGDHGNV